MGKTLNRLRTDVENFLARTGMSDRQFGLQSLNDTRVVHDLRAAQRKFSADHVDAMNEFMEKFQG
jgi:hypothetical protein